MRRALTCATRLAAWAALLGLGACEAEGSLGRWIGDAAPEQPLDAAPDATSEATLDASPPPITEAEQLFCDERGGGPGCGYCLGDSCCREILRCTTEDACDCWLDCTRDRSLTECSNECGAATQSWQPFATCSDKHCAGACPLD